MMKPYWYMVDGDEGRPPERDLLAWAHEVPVDAMDQLQTLRELLASANAASDQHSALGRVGHLYGDVDVAFTNLLEHHFGPYAAEIRYHVIDSGEGVSYVVNALAREERALTAMILAGRAAAL